MRNADLPRSELGLNLAANAAFNGFPLDLTKSVVKVPDVVSFDDPAVQRDVVVTKELDRIFVENMRNDSSLKWQYFGSANGVLRTFPGRRWTASVG